MWNVFQILDGHRGHVTNTLPPNWKNIPPRIEFLCKYLYLGLQHSYSEEYSDLYSSIFLLSQIFLLVNSLYSLKPKLCECRTKWNHFLFKCIVLEKFSRNILSSWRDTGNRARRGTERDKVYERAWGMSEAGFKDKNDKSDLNRKPGRLPEDDTNVDPWHLWRGESCASRWGHTQENSMVELRGRCPGCGVQVWDTPPLRNRDRKCGRKSRTKNEEICWYSSQEKANRRWELREMGKSKTAQNFKVKLESWQDLCGFRLKAC